MPQSYSQSLLVPVTNAQMYNSCKSNHNNCGSLLKQAPPGQWMQHLARLACLDRRAFYNFTTRYIMTRIHDCFDCKHLEGANRLTGFKGTLAGAEANSYPSCCKPVLPEVGELVREGGDKEISSRGAQQRLEKKSTHLPRLGDTVSYFV